MTNTVNNNNGEIEQAVVPERRHLKWLWLLPVLLGALAIPLAVAHQRNSQTVTDPLPTPTVTAPEATPTQPTVPDPEPTAPETDWSNYPIIVNGVGIPDNFITIGDDQIFPTHVPLQAVADALGVEEVHYAQGDSQVFRLDGHKGAVQAMVGSAEATIYDDQNQSTIVQLDAPVEYVDGVIYVPINFWRDAFGAASATFEGGHVRISDTEVMD